MDDDQRDLLRRLFVAAVERLESAHDAAIAGQAPGRTAEESVGAARRLENAARDIAALAGAVIVVARPCPDYDGTEAEQNRF